MQSTNDFELDPQQQEAVNTVDGPILVEAGPGTGKTAMIAHRFANLVNNHGVNPHEILVVSFTNAVINEIYDRLDPFEIDWEDGPRSDSIWIRTFNATGKRLLDNHWLELGLKFKPTTTNVSKAREHYNQVLIDGGFDPELFPQADPEDKGSTRFLQLISQAKANLIPPSNVVEWASERAKIPLVYAEKFAKLYQQYNQVMYSNHKIDFDDQLRLPVVGLQNNRETILKKIQGMFSHIMVDAYQDLTKAQWTLVELIAENNNNIMLVGDLDQYVYGFRDTEQDRMYTSIHSLTDPNNYPDIKRITLRVCYRSTQRIVNSPLRLINLNQREKPKDLVSARIEGPKPFIFKARDEEQEIYWVWYTIRRLAKHGFKFGDIAILYRTHKYGDHCESILNRYNRKYSEHGQVEFERINSYDQWERRVEGTPKPNKVSLFTMHRSKGMEFRVVFLIGLIDGLMPLLIEGEPDNTEDERRLFYVAMTRAKDLLFLSWPKEREELENKRSRYIDEIPHDMLQEYQSADDLDQQISPFLVELSEEKRRSITIRESEDLQLPVPDGTYITEVKDNAILSLQIYDDNGHCTDTPIQSNDPDLPPNIEGMVKIGEMDISVGMAVYSPKFGHGTITSFAPGEGSIVTAKFANRDQDVTFLVEHSELYQVR